ncbi:serine/threonine-protein kinase [Polyangium sp. 15x6]|uniref:serine/threonine-protein kinase n=1 Tax=Polyangium sp. 15x6 TaxID=3042687 RepID=UPI00249AD048|nr:serine/threonine-protein kinase [Polyangium sp. 15x6]MDI3282989.1 serine/threonine-protein kinase [Polyangium sp. 15x6]
MPPPPGQDPSALSFMMLAEIAAGESAKVDLCRVTHGPAEGRLVAVKRLHPHLASDPAFVAQFRDEMWMTGALRHPNVVEVVGWGSDDQGLYLAVELVQGVSLARLMKTIFDTGEAFTERMVVFLARQICRGLGTAHALRAPSGEHMNLVHRDLTPGNVLCSFQGDVKITDFGLAKAKQRLTRTLTGMVKGQLEYISPEQATGNNIDARADIFSLGVMLFELFAARRPWVAPNDMELARLIMTAPPADLFKLRPKIDRELVSIVSKCLEKDPKARFQSVVEILARLDEWLSAHGYMEDNEEALGRFVRRNAMRQMAWFERVIASQTPEVKKEKPRPPTFTGGSVVAPLPRDPPKRSDSPPPTERPGTKRSTGANGPPIPDANELADDTTAEAKVTPRRIGTLRNAPRIADGRGTGEGEVDWGEEVPTLVKGTPEQLAMLRQQFKGGKPFDPKLVAPDVAAARPAPPPEAPEDKRIALPSFATVIEGKLPAAPSRRDDPADSEDLDDPTAPIGDMLRKVRAATAARAMPPAPPGQIVPADPSVPLPPVTARSAGSAPPPPPTGEPSGEDRLRGEAERLSLEAMRLAEEAKAAYARAERKAALAKATSDAAAIAAEALRIGKTQGITDGLRRLEVALAMERSARATEGAAAQTVSVPPPVLAAMAPPPIPPAAQIPALAAAIPSPSAPPIAGPSIPAPPPIPPAPPVPGRSVPPGATRLPDRHALPAPELDPDAFTTRLRPRVLGLQTPVLVAIGVGVVVLVLVVIVISFS